MMKAASLNDIKKELNSLDQDVIQSLCMRLAKYKKENKELLTYLLFEAHDEASFVSSVKEEIHELFQDLPSNTYYLKKTLRKILRHVNKQIKYSGIKETELELRVSFCLHVKEAKIPLQSSAVLFNLYQQQVKKITATLDKLPEDLQADYQREIDLLT
jgi:membrane-anchored protein YejM (alkaline phosphatase superfamily)